MKKIWLVIITFIIAGGVAFYGGTKYQQSKNSLGDFPHKNFQNLSEEQSQQAFSEDIGGNFRQGASKGSGQNSLTGEVITKDEESLTLKMPDSGSRIVFFSTLTKIVKITDGSIDDIIAGKQITVSGEQNSDGSYTAKMIQTSSH